MQRDDAGTYEVPGGLVSPFRAFVPARGRRNPPVRSRVLSRRCMSGRCWLRGRLTGSSALLADRPVFPLRPYCGREPCCPPRSRAPSPPPLNLLLFDWRRPPAFPTRRCGRGFPANVAGLSTAWHGWPEGLPALLPLAAGESTPAAGQGYRGARSALPGSFAVAKN